MEERDAAREEVAFGPPSAMRYFAALLLDMAISLHYALFSARMTREDGALPRFHIFDIISADFALLHWPFRFRIYALPAVDTMLMRDSRQIPPRRH